MPETVKTEAVLARLREIVDRVEREERDLTDEEAASYEQTEKQLSALRRSEEIKARQAAYDTPVTDGLPVPAAPVATAPRNPLAYTRQALDQIGDLARRRATGRVDAGSIENVALTTGTFGQPAEWGGNLLSGPRMLHVVAGVPQQDINAVLAEFPSLTLPTAQPASAEAASLVEYDSSTGGSVALGRFGRFTKFSGESTAGTSLGPVLSMHQGGDRTRH